MDYIRKIDKIVESLAENNLPDLAAQILEVKKDAFTASELLMSVVHELMLILEKNENVKPLIERDVIELNDYCRSIGLVVR